MMKFDGNNSENSEQQDLKNQKTSDDQTNQEQSVDVEMQTSADQCLTELAIWQDQCKRISAEFENFKRRVDKDKMRWTQIAQESLLIELLSFYDTFQLALQQKGNAVDQTAMNMLSQSLMKLLQKHDVTLMPETIIFDPEFHEAVMQVQSEQHKSGEIVQILSQGFMLKDRVLRHAKVSVAL